ncbi:MAG: hypothetical protein QCH99_04715 [Candidatus Bathyarchaeota archaeon]|nr:hypothetical protein [Candidatus Bathyarchaeum tardum]
MKIRKRKIDSGEMKTSLILWLTRSDLLTKTFTLKDIKGNYGDLLTNNQIRDVLRNLKKVGVLASPPNHPKSYKFKTRFVNKQIKWSNEERKKLIVRMYHEFGKVQRISVLWQVGDKIKKDLCEAVGLKLKDLELPEDYVSYSPERQE